MLFVIITIGLFLSASGSFNTGTIEGGGRPVVWFGSGCAQYGSGEGWSWYWGDGQEGRALGAYAVVGTGPLYNITGRCAETFQKGCVKVNENFEAQCSHKTDITPKLVSTTKPEWDVDYYFVSNNLPSATKVLVTARNFGRELNTAGKRLTWLAANTLTGDDGLFVKKAEISLKVGYVHENVSAIAGEITDTTQLNNWKILFGNPKHTPIRRLKLVSINEVSPTSIKPCAKLLGPSLDIENRTPRQIREVPSLPTQCYISPVNWIGVLSQVDEDDTHLYDVGTMWEIEPTPCIESTSRRLLKWAYNQSFYSIGCAIHADCTVEMDKGHGIINIKSSTRMPIYVKIRSKPEVVALVDAYRAHLPIAGHVYVECGNVVFDETVVQSTESACSALIGKWTWIPHLVIKGFCTHPVLASVILVLLIVFVIGYLLMETMIGCFLGLACLPCLTGVWYILDTYMKKCHRCNQNWHVGNCGVVCRCGRQFDNTFALKNHTLMSKCTRQKFRSMRMTFSLNSIKFLLAVLITILILGMIPAVTASVHPSKSSTQTAYISCSTMEYGRCSGGRLEVAMPLETGVFTNFKVWTEDDSPYGMLHVGITKAGIQNSYSHKYDTGKTLKFDVKHKEACTGPCPSHDSIKKMKEMNNHGLIFSKERTNRWGCEEFGCLAVNTGCLFGMCANVIEATHKVYQKNADLDLHTSEVSIRFGSSNFEVTLSDEVQRHGNFEFIQEFQDSSLLPTRIVEFPDKTLRSGAINALGSFNKQCGNIQKTLTNQILGKGEVSWDYTCHNAAQKTVIVKKCMDDDFPSCDLLDVLEQTTHVFKAGKMFRHLRGGTLRINIDIGEFQLATKSDSTSTEIGGSGQCTGCYACVTGISISLSITSTDQKSCPVSTDLSLVTTSSLLVDRGTKFYKILAHSETNVALVTLQVCDSKIKVECHLTHSDDSYYEIAGQDSIEYHSNLRSECTNWFCMFQVDLSGVFGKIGGIFMTVLIIIVILVISPFILAFIGKSLKWVLWKAGDWYKEFRNTKARRY